MQTAVLAVLLNANSHAQTTGGVISGRVSNPLTAEAVPGAAVQFTGETLFGTRFADAAGRFVIPSVSPGVYRLRVTAPGFQPQEIYELTVPVAGLLEADISLRPVSDVWEQRDPGRLIPSGTRAVLPFFGPDLDFSRTQVAVQRYTARGTLDATLSTVVKRDWMLHLPLLGRDAYTLLAMQPTAAGSTATAQSLGLAVNGQRPTASNFLLDGLENNNLTTTGPLISTLPEALDEYRVSTSSYSAEYGRTAGYIANTVTRSGGETWHGTGWFYFGQHSLNANTFERNRTGIARAPFRDRQVGFTTSGALRKGLLYASATLEGSRLRTEGEPETFSLPTPRILRSIRPGGSGANLLRNFPPPPGKENLGLKEDHKLSQPAVFERLLAIPRIDLIQGEHRWMARWAYSGFRRPDFYWSPYPGFSSPLWQRNSSGALTHVRTLSPQLTLEMKIGLSQDGLSWERAHPEIPSLVSSEGIILPGSPGLYDYRNRGRNIEAVVNLGGATGSHLWKTGAGLLQRNTNGHLTIGRDGVILFSNFLQDEVDSFQLPVSRPGPPNLSAPDFDRAYRSRHAYAFVQDTWRVTRDLVLNLGMRYERFGSPVVQHSNGEVIVRPGEGAAIQDRIARATLGRLPQGSQLTVIQSGNWAPRFGFTYRVPGLQGTVLRASYGLFFDRPFDNQWQGIRTNAISLARFTPTNIQFDYLRPTAEWLRNVKDVETDDFPPLLMYLPQTATPYSRNYFVGLQHSGPWESGWEIAGTGALGRRLLTTDSVNRFSAQGTRLNPKLGNIDMRAFQGQSSYHGLAASGFIETSPILLRATYTWSHLIDQQSDPLAGDFFDPSASRASAENRGPKPAAFTRVFDPRGDRANSDFDQRHNLILLSVLPLPAPRKLRRLLGGWQVSGVFIARSGQPYSVLFQNSTEFLNNRPDLIDPALLRLREPVEGGVRLLNRDALREVDPDSIGNLGRNALNGPGFWNTDASLSRTFGLPILGERSLLRIRADLFNIFNHANLNNPNSVWGSDTFGIASYGRPGRATGFPALIPFDETPRRVQFLARLEF